MLLQIDINWKTDENTIQRKWKRFRSYYTVLFHHWCLGKYSALGLYIVHYAEKKSMSAQLALCGHACWLLPQLLGHYVFVAINS